MSLQSQKLLAVAMHNSLGVHLCDVIGKMTQLVVNILRTLEQPQLARAAKDFCMG